MLLPNPRGAADAHRSGAGFAGAIQFWGEAGRDRAAGSSRPSEGGRRPPPRHYRTSSVSRRPSPTRLMASTVSARRRPGNRMIQNASCTYVLPSAMMLPHDGMWGGVPAPRNDRYASNRMAEAQM